ncbi:MAG: hypothetical protein ABIK07_10715 [Planctomycetota bacterium]
MKVSKELFEIARVAEQEQQDRHAIDCVKFETDGLRNEASATDGRIAIHVKWPALEETEGAESYLIPASDCLQIKPGIKRIAKQATAKISDGDDGFTLFEEFNKTGAVFRSPTTKNKFPNVKALINERVYSEHDSPSYSFNISRLTTLLTAIEKIIGANETVDLRFDDNGTNAVIVVEHTGTKCVEAMLLVLSGNEE